MHLAKNKQSNSVRFFCFKLFNFIILFKLRHIEEE